MWAVPVGSELNEGLGRRLGTALYDAADLRHEVVVEDGHRN